MASIDPTAEQITRFTESEADGAILMLNLLRFKDAAGGGDGLTGEEAYRRYGEAVGTNEPGPGRRRRAPPGPVYQHRHRTRL